VSTRHTRGKARVRLETTQSLRKALRRGELLLHYQPIVDLATGQPVAAEALVRWEHPVQGMVTPGRFIPIAEQSDLIMQLGAWVLDEACQVAASWVTEFGSMEISVNLSGRQLGDHQLESTVKSALSSSGLEPARLCLEITESAVMSNPTDAVQLLRNLKGLGIMLSIDDFGTGYSSLAYLKRFPVDSLKIDRSFVDGLGHDTDDEKIVDAVMRLAQAFDLSVVAEGVEMADQLKRLTEMHCDRAQGYYFAPPMSAKDLHTWLTIRR